QLQAGYGRKAHAVDTDRFTMDTQLDVAPGLQPPRYGVQRLCVVRPQKLQGLIREHDTKAKSRTGVVLFIDIDQGVGPGTFQQVRRIQTRRAATKNIDLHFHASNYDSSAFAPSRPRTDSGTAMACMAGLPPGA